LIDIEQSVQKLRHGKYNMKIPYGQESTFKFIHPELLFYVLTLGAVPIAAGVVAYLLMTTAITLSHMHTQCSSTTSGDSLVSFLLTGT
jgi:hypothetical protein